MECEFVKLSDINVRPCRACKACVKDNICKVKDDFPELANKIQKAQALVIAGYTPNRMLDAYTKALLERLWSMRHNNSLNAQKLVITIISGLSKQTRDTALKSIAMELLMEKAHHVAELSIERNVPCLTCGYGDSCDFCVTVENHQVWEKGGHIGRLVGQYIKGEIVDIPCVRLDMNELMYRT